MSRYPADFCNDSAFIKRAPGKVFSDFTGRFVWRYAGMIRTFPDRERKHRRGTAQNKKLCAFGDFIGKFCPAKEIYCAKPAQNARKKERNSHNLSEILHLDPIRRAALAHLDTLWRDEYGGGCSARWKRILPKCRCRRWRRIIWRRYFIRSDCSRKRSRTRCRRAFRGGLTGTRRKCSDSRLTRGSGTFSGFIGYMIACSRCLINNCPNGLVQPNIRNGCQMKEKPVCSFRRRTQSGKGFGRSERYADRKREGHMITYFTIIA